MALLCRPDADGVDRAPRPVQLTPSTELVEDDPVQPGPDPLPAPLGEAPVDRGREPRSVGPNHRFDTDRMMAVDCTRALLVDCDAGALPAQAVLCAHDLLCVLEYVEEHGRLHYALALEGALAWAWDLLRALTTEVVALLDLSDGLHPDHETLLSLLDDFIGADLRRANPTGVKWDGSWWSETSTSRPPHVDIGLLKPDSVETAPGSGIYVTPQRGMTSIPDSLACA